MPTAPMAQPCPQVEHLACQHTVPGVQRMPLPLPTSKSRGQSCRSPAILQRLLLREITRLDFGSCDFGFIRRQQIRIERLCRLLLDLHDHGGALYYAYLLRRWGYSHVDADLDACTRSAELYATYLPRLLAKRAKSGFDCYVLGLEFQRGNKTGRQLAASRVLFRRACTAGIGLARHEVLMSTMADDAVSDAEKRRVLSKPGGMASRDSIHARTIFELSGLPVEQSPNAHAWMRLLLAAWKREVYSTVGKQYLNVRVESCIKRYMAFVRSRSDLTAEDYIALGRIAESSRAVSSDSKPYEFYRLAALLGHLDAAETYVRLTPEPKREHIEHVILQGFGSIPPQIAVIIRDKFEDPDE